MSPVDREAIVAAALRWERVADDAQLGRPALEELRATVAEARMMCEPIYRTQGGELVYAGGSPDGCGRVDVWHLHSGRYLGSWQLSSLTRVEG